MSQGTDPFHSDLVEMAYAAVEDGRSWEGFAAALAARFEACQAAVVITDAWGTVPPLTGWARPDDGAAYLTHFHRIDPFLDAALVDAMSRTPRAWLSQELIDESQLRASAFYTDYLRPRGNLFWGCGGNYALADGVRLQFGVMRDKALGRYDDSDRQALDGVVRHVQRAARLALRLSGLDRRTAHHAAVQDSLLDAVFVLDAGGRIVQRNARALALLNEHAGDTHFAPRALKLAGAAEQGRLAEALTRAQRDGDEPARSLRLQRHYPLPPLYAIVMPLHGSDGAVQLFLRDPRWRPQLPEQALCELFELTPAQARVCSALARGEPLDRIAQELGVSLNTVRSHLKLAMERVGVNRQSDLVRQLSAALPAFGSVDNTAQRCNVVALPRKDDAASAAGDARTVSPRQ